MIRSRSHVGEGNASLPIRRRAPPAQTRSWLGWVIAAAAVGSALVYVTRSVLFILFAAAVFAWLLDRPVSELQRRGASRSFAILVVTGAIVTGLLVLIVGVLPNTVHQIAVLSANLTPYIDNLNAHVGPWSAAIEARFKIDIPVDLQELGKLGPQYLQELSPDFRAKLQEWARTAASGGLSLVISVISLSLLPLFTFFLLRDWPHLVGYVDDLVPVPARAVVGRLVGEIDARLAGWVRGQLTVAFVLGCVYSLGLMFSGIDLAITVGLLGGALFLVPYVGPLITGSLALSLALLKFGFDWHVGAVAGTFILGQALEGTVLTPLLVGDRVGLHPMVVMVALIVGGNLLGILGIVLAVPATAALAVIGAYLLERWRESRTFRG